VSAPDEQKNIFARFPDLAGRVVFDTGGASGIGLAMAHGFAANGAKLALVDIDKPALDVAAEELRTAHPGVEVITIAASVIAEDDLASAVERTVGELGGLDIVLSNAGVSSNKPSLELAADEWRRTIDIDLTGVFLTAQAAARHMAAQGSGVVLSTSSMWGVAGSPERVAYCAAKAGVVSMTKCLGAEWAPLGIRVNAIGPGYIRTALVEDLMARGRIDLGLLERATPLGRIGEPAEMANLALFLASDKAGFITGQTFVADGGWTANGYLAAGMA